MNPLDLVGCELNAIWVLPHEVHAAWRDPTTPSLASGFANLDISDMDTVKIQPCEVEHIQGKYPALGIELLSVPEPPMIHRSPQGGDIAAVVLRDAVKFLPSRVSAVRVWDALGEGPDSALTLTLENGRTIVIRHIYPPMTLGIEFGAA